MNAYLDSSAILRIILRERGPVSDWARFDVRVCSDLVEVECMRALDRLRLLRELTEPELVAARSGLLAFLSGTERVGMTPAVLRRASESFPVVIGTLDAIHLSTALAWQDAGSEELVMVTHDKALAQAARAQGLPVAGA
ncbi:MAG: type II toxin-antitoxin system VapC family toxin [Nitrospirae bacterium]|nr:type II toxin-antitoxin system VapC family toxin [Nitrospirota bacterium]